MTLRVHDYHDGNRQLQDRFDSRRLADHLVERVSETIGQPQKEFIEKADMFFLATCDHRGLPTCSYKGGDSGFVKVLNDRWLAFPNYDGNGKFQSMGNLLKNPNAGMLFVDFERQQRMRLQGIASILDDDELLLCSLSLNSSFESGLPRCTQIAPGMFTSIRRLNDPSSCLDTNW